MEYSKKLLLFSWFITLILTLITLIFSVAKLPVDALLVLTPLAWAETGTATGFYFWKSKNENRAKYAQRFITKYAEKYGVDTALRLAEIILKD